MILFWKSRSRKFKQAFHKLNRMGYYHQAERVKYLYNYEQNEPEDWSNHPDDEPMNMKSLKMLVQFLEAIEKYIPMHIDPAIGMSYDGSLGLTYDCDKHNKTCEVARAYSVNFNNDGTISTAAILGVHEDGKFNTVSCTGTQEEVLFLLNKHRVFSWKERTHEKTRGHDTQRVS